MFCSRELNQRLKELIDWLKMTRYPDGVVEMVSCLKWYYYVRIVIVVAEGSSQSPDTMLVEDNTPSGSRSDVSDCPAPTVKS